jgi:hypothetical protein
LDNTILDVSISHGSPYTMIKLAQKQRPQHGGELRPSFIGCPLGALLASGNPYQSASSQSVPTSDGTACPNFKSRVSETLALSSLLYFRPGTNPRLPRDVGGQRVWKVLRRKR